MEMDVSAGGTPAASPSRAQLASDNGAADPSVALEGADEELAGLMRDAKSHLASYFLKVGP
jgi:hypothetical protein